MPGVDRSGAPRRALLAAFAAPALLRPAAARAQEVTLRLHHFLPATANMHRHFLQPWAQKVGADSGGRVRIQIFPAMQLGGAPPQLYDQARDGVADIVWTLPGTTPGRFPRVEVFELPFVAHRLGVPNGRAVQEFYERHLRDEYREVHPICVWGCDGGAIHASREVRTMEDLRGLKLRFANRQNGEALRALGAAPVGMPASQVPEAISQRVLDGAMQSWEVLPSLRLHEMVRNHTVIPGNPTLTVVTFILAMNPARYAALSPEAKRALDANSGMVAAEGAARVWDDQVPIVMDMARRRGNVIVTLSDDEVARWRAATRPVTEAWVRTTPGGAALLEDALALVAKHGRGI